MFDNTQQGATTTSEQASRILVSTAWRWYHDRLSDILQQPLGWMDRFIDSYHAKFEFEFEFELMHRIDREQLPQGRT
jgi:hypothetical protein